MSVAEDGIESEYIPTIDFSLLSASVEDEDLNLEMLEWLSEHVLFALKNTGKDKTNVLLGLKIDSKIVSKLLPKNI